MIPQGNNQLNPECVIHPIGKMTQFLQQINDMKKKKKGGKIQLRNKVT